MITLNQKKYDLTRTSKEIRIDGANYEIGEHQLIVDWINLYGEVVSDIQEEAVVVEDSAKMTSSPWLQTKSKNFTHLNNPLTIKSNSCN